MRQKSHGVYGECVLHSIAENFGVKIIENVDDKKEEDRHISTYAIVTELNIDQIEFLSICKKNSTNFLPDFLATLCPIDTIFFNICVKKSHRLLWSDFLFWLLIKNGGSKIVEKLIILFKSLRRFFF